MKKGNVELEKLDDKYAHEYRVRRINTVGQFMDKQDLVDLYDIISSELGLRNAVEVQSEALGEECCEECARYGTAGFKDWCVIPTCPCHQPTKEGGYMTGIFLKGSGIKEENLPLHDSQKGLKVPKGEPWPIHTSQLHIEGEKEEQILLGTFFAKKLWVEDGMPEHQMDILKDRLFDKEYTAKLAAPFNTAKGLEKKVVEKVETVEEWVKDRCNCCGNKEICLCGEDLEVKESITYCAECSQETEPRLLCKCLQRKKDGSWDWSLEDKPVQNCCVGEHTCGIGVVGRENIQPVQKPLEKIDLHDHKNAYCDYQLALKINELIDWNEQYLKGK